MNLSWTPLWSDIVDSSVWGLPKHVKILWITMLAMKDRGGRVTASVSGLARRAVLEVGEVLDALEVLKAPDHESKTRDHEGRRIQEIEGGWFILNAEKMVDRMSKEKKRVKDRIRQAEYRARKKANKPPTFEERVECGEVKED